MAYALSIPNASVHGDGYASGEPDAVDAWVIVPPAVSAASDPRVRVFPTDAAAYDWRNRRATYQRARGRVPAVPKLMTVDAGRVTTSEPQTTMPKTIAMEPTHVV